MKENCDLKISDVISNAEMTQVVCKRFKSNFQTIS